MFPKLEVLPGNIAVAAGGARTTVKPASGTESLDALKHAPSSDGRKAKSAGSY